MPPPNNDDSQPLTLPPHPTALITPYLPHPSNNNTSIKKPHVTLTYAQSLDSALSLGPGLRTTLSGPQSKAMTHFLRAHHDAILVGAGTAVADDPGLNSRYSFPSSSSSEEEKAEVGTVKLSSPDGAMAGWGETGGGKVGRIQGRVRQPRPVVLDPRGRWAVGAESKVVGLAREGRGLAPFVLVGEGTEVPEERRRVVEDAGGRYFALEAKEAGRFAWGDVLALLAREGLGSVMVEGGAEVINGLLVPPGSGFVDSVIVTVAPTWLGKGGVVVSPPRGAAGEGGQPPPSVRLTDVTWCPLGEDVVLCGRILK